LTAREHLEFYARIKGVKEANMRSIVDGMLHYLSLKEYADRPAGTYSGGNKRKLSVAIALIGDPSIVFLDEPSTGMDPSARRFMWRFISDTMRDRSVILTTH
jgi:ABC-type multidrug transport system ATPase subunit